MGARTCMVSIGYSYRTTLFFFWYKRMQSQTLDHKQIYATNLPNLLDNHYHFSKKENTK